MKKYELREGEKFIDDFFEKDGTHITVIKDKNGKIYHCCDLDIDENLIQVLGYAADLKGLTIQKYIDETLESAIILLIEENDKRFAIEEISD